MEAAGGVVHDRLVACFAKYGLRPAQVSVKFVNNSICFCFPRLRDKDGAIEDDDNARQPGLEREVRDMIDTAGVIYFVHTFASVAWLSDQPTVSLVDIAEVYRVHTSYPHHAEHFVETWRTKAEALEHFKAVVPAVGGNFQPGGFCDGKSVDDLMILSWRYYHAYLEGGACCADYAWIEKGLGPTAHTDAFFNSFQPGITRVPWAASGVKNGRL